MTLDPDPLHVPEDYIEFKRSELRRAHGYPDPIPDRPRFPLLTWTLLVTIIAIAAVAFLIANRHV